MCGRILRWGGRGARTGREWRGLLRRPRYFVSFIDLNSHRLLHLGFGVRGHRMIGLMRGALWSEVACLQTYRSDSQAYCFNEFTYRGYFRCHCV